ncbi:MAG: ABC transporter substrate-binding protein [Pyrinomonadaceae bacterium]
MPKQSGLIFIALLAYLSIFVLACGSAPPANQTAPAAKIEPRTTGGRGGKVSYRLTAAPKTLNYLLAADEASIVAAFYMLTSRLIEFDHSTQKFVPGLAESWTTGGDGRTIDVKLRDGLRFSDGDALTADDVVFSLAAIYDEKTQSPVFRDAMMVGGKKIETNKINDLELQLIFPQPVASAENYLVNLGILPSHVLEPELRAGRFPEAWKINAPPESIVSSGPFVVETTTPGERIDYARNAHYWKKDEKGTQLPYLDKFSIEIIADANNTFAKMRQGNLDMADRIRPNDYVEFTKTPGDVRAFDVGPGLGIDHLWFNLNTTDADGKPLGNEAKRIWFGDKRFRQAVAAAIDRETIASVTLQGLASPLYGIVSPANKVWINPSLRKIEYSLPRAEQLLKDAGFQKTGASDDPVLMDPRGAPVEFTMIVPAENEPRKLMAAVVQQDLARLGIKMQVVPLEFPAVTERWTKSFDYDAVLLGLSQTDIEPSSYQNFLLSSAPTHQWQPKQKTPATEWEARIDKLFAEQAVELDQANRFQIFSEIQSIMQDEMPVIPLAARHVVAATHARVGNFSPSSILPYSLWNVEQIFIKQ